MKDNRDYKQAMWEIWFVSSIIIVLGYLFVGVLEGSKYLFPNWPYFTTMAMFNLIICILVGTRKR